MRIFFRVVSLLWFVFFGYAGISVLLDAPGQIKRDRDFIEFQIKPHVDFVKKFKVQHARLPSDWEFRYKEFDSSISRELIDTRLEWPVYVRSKRSIVFDGDLDKFAKADWTKDYAIGMWRGEWMEYYFSWTDSYDSNNYTLTDGLIGLIMMWTIGFIPMFFVVRSRIRQRTRSS